MAAGIQSQEYVVNEVALRQDSLLQFRFTHHYHYTNVSYPHSSIYHRRYIILLVSVPEHSLLPLSIIFNIFSEYDKDR